jgi:glycosyltransferase involved in cell wall biosynthesis
MRHAPWHFCILIPARNEEALLARCLKSVVTACSRLPPSVTYDIVVAVDCSTDKTFEIAHAMTHAIGTVVLTDAGIVGEVRALATQLALARYQGSLKSCWLANTDADCIVPENWLLDQLSLAEADVEAVAGTVEVDTFDEHDSHVPELFRATYLMGHDGTHLHVYGANLGIRADVYLQVGGWNSHATAEDHDLWNRVKQIGARRKSVDRPRVVTSGRRIGRAPHGFAGALAAHNVVTV